MTVCTPKSVCIYLYHFFMLSLPRILVAQHRGAIRQSRQSASMGAFAGVGFEMWLLPDHSAVLGSVTMGFHRAGIAPRLSKNLY